MLIGKKYMGMNNRLVCAYDIKTKAYQMYYADGNRLTFIKEYYDRSSAIFYLNILNNASR